MPWPRKLTINYFYPAPLIYGDLNTASNLASYFYWSKVDTHLKKCGKKFGLQKTTVEAKLIVLLVFLSKGVSER